MAAMMGDLSGVKLLLLLLFFATPFGVLTYMFWLFWTRARDPERESISVQYEPPDNLTPGECGALLDDAVALRDITATLTDLSVKGYLAIERKQDGESPSVTQPGYIFHLTKPPGEWEHLRPHEQEVLKCIFISTNALAILSESMTRLEGLVSQNALKIRHDPGGLLSATLSATLSRVHAKTEEATELYRSVSGAPEGPQFSVGLLDLQSHFSLQLPNIRNVLFDGLVTAGFYEHRPDRLRQIYAVKGIFLGILMAFIGYILASATGGDAVELILTGMLTGATVLVFGWLLPARTGKGLRTVVNVLGFREFIRRVEKDYIDRIEKTPELFEKYLPYAMALGVENSWTQAFARISVPLPNWYRGAPGLLPMNLVDDLKRMSQATPPEQV